MRTLVISDVHGNLAALEAVLAAEPWDELVCLGDLVGYGPEPAACVELVRRHSVVVVQGNHDRALADGVPPRCRPSFEELARVTHAITRVDLSPGDLAFLRGLPRWLFLERSGRRFLLVHAAPSDPLYRYREPDDSGWSREIELARADVFLVGHTHRQYEAEVEGVRIVNPGSVGQPRDGDPSAAYALIEDGEVRLGRASYPVDETAERLAARGVPSAALRQLTALLRTGRVPALLRA